MEMWFARLLSTVLVFAFMTGCQKQSSPETPTQGASAAMSASIASPAATAALPPLPASDVAPVPASAVLPQVQAHVPQYPPDELEALVAPIALYPDSLLSQVLMASTYPLEVVHAARWVKEHRDLKGEGRGGAGNSDSSVSGKSWGPSRP
ncbi:hypothetical protein BSFA1_22660 [Burkholderia sp. SFA1]|nr:hypothetical protein BSFA1_22660 [Burkholderia sp. SFA1]